MVKATKKVSLGTKLKKFLNNPKHVVLVVFVLGFAFFGGYKLYESASAKIYKSPTTVGNCYTSATLGGSTSYLRYPTSEGGCVQVFFSALAAIDDATGDKLGYVPVGSKYYSTGMKEDVVAYQSSKGQLGDGIIGKYTWSALNSDCSNYSLYSSVRIACGL